MGRRPLKKHRKSDAGTTELWISRISPVFHQHGFREFTMDEVVQIAGVSKATFYKYYSSRDKLIEDVIQFKLRELTSFRERLFNTEISYYERFVDTLQATAFALSEISTQYLSDLKTLFPEKWKAIEEFKNFALAQLELFYEEGIRDGLLKETNPRMLVLLDRIFFEKITDPKFLASSETTMHAIFQEYFQVKTEGIIKKSNRTELLRKRMEPAVNQLV